MDRVILPNHIPAHQFPIFSRYDRYEHTCLITYYMKYVMKITQKHTRITNDTNTLYGYDIANVFPQSTTCCCNQKLEIWEMLTSCSKNSNRATLPI